MDKKALLTKLIIDDTLTQQRIPVHEELVIALYEDTKIAQHIDFIIDRIKAKTAEKITLFEWLFYSAIQHHNIK